MTKIPLCRYCSGRINPIWLWQKQVQCPYYTRIELHLPLGLSLAHHIPHFWAQSPELRILFFFLLSLAPRSQVHVLIGPRINGLVLTLKQTDRLWGWEEEHIWLCLGITPQGSGDIPCLLVLTLHPLHPHMHKLFLIATSTL